MSKVFRAMLALAAVAWAQPVAAEPASQAAFRAVLVKFDERADAETDLARLRELEAERAAELAKVLAEGLKFDDWQLILSGTESTPMGGIFVRFLDAALTAPKSVRAEISAKAPLREPVALLKRGTLVVVSGHFFPDDKGGPYYESARISWQDLAVERARFRMPYFSIAVVDVGELFPDRRFP